MGRGSETATSNGWTFISVQVTTSSPRIKAQPISPSQRCRMHFLRLGGLQKPAPWHQKQALSTNFEGRPDRLFVLLGLVTWRYQVLKYTRKIRRSEYTRRCAPRTFGSTNLSTFALSPWQNPGRAGYLSSWLFIYSVPNCSKACSEQWCL